MAKKVTILIQAAYRFYKQNISKKRRYLRRLSQVSSWPNASTNYLSFLEGKRLGKAYTLCDGHKKAHQTLLEFFWSASMVRIMLMYYVNSYLFLEEPEKDWAKKVQEAMETPPEPSLFD